MNDGDERRSAAARTGSLSPSGGGRAWCRRRRGAGVLLVGMLAACGGGGGGGGAADATVARFAAQCAEPRTGLDPFNFNRPYPDQQGSLASERAWVLAHMNAVYLWYDEIPRVNASVYNVANTGSVMNALDAYFNALRTPVLTASGKRKDQFSFTAPTQAWEAQSQEGVALGYGVSFVLLAGAPPREAVIAYTEPQAPYAELLTRGLRIVAIDGVDFVNDPSQAGVDVLIAGLFPVAAGEQHVFRLRRNDEPPFDVLLSAQAITQTPVPTVRVLDTENGRVGYLLFNDHIATAEGPLIAAMTQFRDAGIDDLVLDLRYNGGGFLDIASELAFMIAGGARTATLPFEQLQFSDRNVRGSVETVTPFYATALGFDPGVTSGAPLPSLDLPRVFVLSSGGTCSASESIINGLRGVDVEVIQVGETTCGKPYGFYPTDNCGLTYFATEFAGVNAKSFGDYADGFVASCAAVDDYEHALGDPAETMLATALQLQAGGACAALAKRASGQDAKLLRSPLREIGYRRS